MSWSTGIVVLCVVLGIHTAGARNVLQSEPARGLSVSYIPEFPEYPVESVDFSHVITLKAPAAINKADRAPIVLTAVLDESGSMAGQKIELVKKSTEFLVQQLQEGDAFGIVSYASNVRETFRLTPVTSNAKKQARSSINEISAGGSTNLSGGLFKGIEQQLGYSTSSKSVNTLLLLTDGLATDGIRDLNTIKEKMAAQLDTPGAPTVYTLGFGLDHDAGFLREIAKTGEGSYVFIEDESAVGSSFGEILGGLLTITAQNIKVTLKALNGASIVSVKGGEVSTRDNVWITKYKDLFAEERRDILVNMKIPATSGPTTSQLVLKATIEYFDISRNTEAKDMVSVVLGRQPAVKQTAPATLVEVTRLRFRVSEDIATAVSGKRSGDKEGATATLDGTIEALAQSPESDDPEVQTLLTDVQSVREEVAAEEELSTTSAIAFSSGAASLSVQRVVGGGSSSKLQSGSRTSSVTRTAAAASNFVNGGR